MFRICPACRKYGHQPSDIRKFAGFGRPFVFMPFLRREITVTEGTACAYDIAEGASAPR